MIEQKPPKWLVDMPKTDLHCHIGGSIRLTTLLKFADKYGIRLPGNDIKTLSKHVVYKHRPNRNLASYIEAIKVCESVFVKPEVFCKVAYEICEDANKENVKILELRFAPTNYNHNGMNLHAITEATLEGLQQGHADFGMHTGLIVIGMRTDPKAARKAAEIAVNYQNKGVVGFDIAGREKGHRPKQLMLAIAPVLDNLLPVTIHAGEEDTVESIKEALVYLNARRIGHGISLRENPKVVEYLDTTRFGLEICITSNYDTGNIACYESHPVKPYYDHGLRLSINTDNRTVSATTVTNEYMILMNYLGFKKADILKLGRDGIKSAFIPSKERRQMLTEFDAYVKKNHVRLFPIL